LANPEVNPAIATTFKVNGSVISLAGGIAQLRNQCIGVVATVLLAAVGTLVILKIVDAVIGLRVQPDEERAGLDLSQHGENAYNA
jgi:Amt family ammonium transporter